MKLVKVAELGQVAVEVSLDDNATVADALRAANKSSSNKDIRIDGTNVSETHRISDQDVIALVPKVKGGISC